MRSLILLLPLLSIVSSFYVQKHLLPSSICLAAKRKGVSSKKGPGKVKSKSDVILIDDIYSDGWMLDAVVSTLQKGGVGVIPTDTCYSFVTLLSNENRLGMERLIKVKGGGRKPLSAICKDISMVSSYAANLSTEKWIYKLLKTTLPGPFTYIMPSSSEVPKMVIDRKHHKLNKIKRKEIGIRIPNDGVCLAIMQQLGEPLLCGSVPQAGEDICGLNWHKVKGDKAAADEEGDEEEEEEEGFQDEGEIDFGDTSYHEVEAIESFDWEVDFVVLNGPRGGAASDQLSTVVDLTSLNPQIVRQGKGELDVSLLGP